LPITAVSAMRAVGSIVLIENVNPGRMWLIFCLLARRVEAVQ
jgi:hypothetical protein